MIYLQLSFTGAQHGLNGTKARNAAQKQEQAKTRNPPLSDEASYNDYSHHQEITYDTFAN